MGSANLVAARHLRRPDRAVLIAAFPLSRSISFARIGISLSTASSGCSRLHPGLWHDPSDGNLERLARQLPAGGRYQSNHGGGFGIDRSDADPVGSEVGFAARTNPPAGKEAEEIERADAPHHREEEPRGGFAALVESPAEEPRSS